MKRLLILALMIPLLLATGCKSEKARRRGAAVAAFASTPLANVVLGCETGIYTNAHLNTVFFNIFTKDPAKLKKAAKQKGLIGALACRYAVGLLYRAMEKFGDDLLSEEMIADKCSTKEAAAKGRDWVLGKCGS